MLHLKLFDLDKAFVFEVCEMLLPFIIELLQFRVSNLDILCQLALLNILPEIILVLDYVLLQLPHLSHQVFEHLIL